LVVRVAWPADRAAASPAALLVDLEA